MYCVRYRDNVHCLKSLCLSRTIGKGREYIRLYWKVSKICEFCCSHGSWVIFPNWPLLLGKSKHKHTDKQTFYKGTDAKREEATLFFPKYIHFQSQQLIISSLLQTALWLRGVWGWPLGTRVSHRTFTDTTIIYSPNQKGTDTTCFFRGCLDFTFTLLCFHLIFHL